MGLVKVILSKEYGMIYICTGVSKPESKVKAAEEAIKTLLTQEDYLYEKAFITLSVQKSRKYVFLFVISLEIESKDKDSSQSPKENPNNLSSVSGNE